MERERMAESCYEVSFELIIGRYSVQMLERINFASTAFDINLDEVKVQLRRKTA